MFKVLIGMSGGVDSTISTQILKDQGYDVEGVYMKLHNKSGYHEENIAKAQKAADFIGVSLHILDQSQSCAFRRMFAAIAQPYLTKSCLQEKQLLGYYLILMSQVSFPSC